MDAVHSQKVGTTSQLQIDSSMLTDGNLDGFSLKMSWSAVEPTDGTFNWTSLDALIAQAAGANKKVTINVMPGWSTPAWVYAAGAKSFNFIWDESGWGPGLCTVANIPVPWDPIYLQKWTNLISALGARYSGNSTVVGLKLAGINSVSGETNLPHSVNEKISNGTTSCTGYDDVTNWQAAGYTRTLIESSWLQIAQAYQQAFPATYLAAVMQPAGFPPIDQFGNIFTSPSGGDNIATEDIVATGVADFAKQFGLQNNALTNSYIWILEESYAPQALTGYQTLAALSANLPPAMTLATGGGAEYLELYEADLLNSSNTTAIANARASLLLN